MTELNGSGQPPEERRSGVARVAAGRVGALMTSVMDLHVRIALQEVDREKRRLISGVGRSHWIELIGAHSGPLAIIDLSVLH